MIIGYFNISRALFSPAEADAVLIVDADAVLSAIFSALRPQAARHVIQAQLTEYPVKV